MEISAFKENAEVYLKNLLSVGGGVVRGLWAQMNKVPIRYIKKKAFTRLNNSGSSTGISLSEYVRNARGRRNTGIYKGRMAKYAENRKQRTSKRGNYSGGLNIKRKAKMLLEKGRTKSFPGMKRKYI